MEGEAKENDLRPISDLIYVCSVDANCPHLEEEG